jgi:hypothetical protein
LAFFVDFSRFFFLSQPTYLPIGLSLRLHATTL